ncbi:MFS transporter [Nonomuraea angiospora]|uniref:MFS transporter n=1 Tax=Nonomuraea angiospora TaxID=46172 RepID=UPI0036A44C1C
MVTAGDAGWGALGTVLPPVAAILLYALFVVVERSVRSPLMRAETLARRPVGVASFVLTAAGAMLMTRISPDASAYTTLPPGFVLAALGIGPAFVTATTTTMANIPPGENGVASGVINTFRELGGSIGVAAVSAVAASSLAPGPVAGIGGFVSGLTLCAVVAGAAAAIALGLVPPGKPATAFVGHGH